jgi:adenylosuccinate lyase
MNGAVGNYNAHLAAYPDFDWEEFSRRVIEQQLGLAFNPYTIQIEPHDYMAELFDAIGSRQHDPRRLVARRVGLHQPRLLQAAHGRGRGGLVDHAAQGQPDRLRERRRQLRPRQCAAHAPEPEAARQPLAARPHRQHGAAQHGRGRSATPVLGYDSLLRGLGKLEVNPQALAADLDAAWEVLAEPIQTVMRRYGLPHPYERLKALTRGKGITRETITAVHRDARDPRRREEAACSR